MNRLISKGKSNIYSYEKRTFSKLRFSRKENLKKCTRFEEQKGTWCTGETFILSLPSSVVSRLQNVVSDFF